MSKHKKKTKKKRIYNAATYASILRWRQANPGEHTKTVQRANRRRIQEAQEILSGSLIAVHCVVSGCPAEQEDLQFHHVKGDGKQHSQELGTRETATMARWVIKHPDEARQRIELRCHPHHREADKLLGLGGGSLGRRKYTAAQVEAILDYYETHLYRETIKYFKISNKTFYAMIDDKYLVK